MKREENTQNIHVLNLVEHFDTSQITIDELHKNGLIGNIQGPRKLYDEMGNLLEFGQYIHNSLSIFKKDKHVLKINEAE